MSWRIDARDAGQLTVAQRRNVYGLMGDGWGMLGCRPSRVVQGAVQAVRLYLAGQYAYVLRNGTILCTIAGGAPDAG